MVHGAEPIRQKHAVDARRRAQHNPPDILGCRIDAVRPRPIYSIIRFSRTGRLRDGSYMQTQLRDVVKSGVGGWRGWLRENWQNTVIDINTLPRQLRWLTIFGY